MFLMRAGKKTWPLLVLFGARVEGGFPVFQDGAGIKGCYKLKWRGCCYARSDSGGGFGTSTPGTG